MLISNIKKDYGTHSTVVLYRKEFNSEPPTCKLHLIINCQLCFKRGKNKNLSDMSDNDLKKYYSSRKTSSRRSKTTVTDYALCNEFSQFITLTFDQKVTDSFNYDYCKKLVSKWINNQRRHSPQLTYILVAEKHKKGAIHFHMITNNYNGELTEARNKKTNRKITKKGKQIYNLKGWNYGFSTLSYIQNKEATSHYLQKYLTKDFIEAFNKKRFWTSRGLNKPVKSYNIDPIKMLNDTPPLFRTLYEHDNYYLYTLRKGCEPTKTEEEIKRFVSKKYHDMITSH